MNTRAPAVLLPLVTGLVLALTSCGVQSFTKSEPDGCPATGPGMCVTLQTSGSETMSGTTFVPRPGDDPAVSCATWVEGEGGNPGQITLPGAFDKKVGGRTVRFGAHIIGYTGPRVYEGDDAIRSGNNPLTVSVGSHGYSTSHALLVRVTAEVRADGSGSVTFANLVQTLTPRDGDRRHINGRFTWTCQD